MLATALLALLFSMMVLLKIYQPRSVSIYLNDHLQEQSDKYFAGGFRDLPATILDPNDHHDGLSPMGAQRFDIWYYGSYLPHRQLPFRRHRALLVILRGQAKAQVADPLRRQKPRRSGGRLHFGIGGRHQFGNHGRLQLREGGRLALEFAYDGQGVALDVLQEWDFEN